MAEKTIDGINFKQRPDGTIEGTIKWDVLRAVSRYLSNARGFTDFEVRPLKEKSKSGITHAPVIIDSKNRFKNDEKNPDTASTKCE